SARRDSVKKRTSLTKVFTSEHDGSVTPTLDAIARPTGTLAMVAMDQRESLRTMFADAGRGRVGDEELTDFKLHVAAELGTHASGFLIDRHYGHPQARDLLAGKVGFILAADALT